ncbi:NADH dehydrogenase subunit 5 (mitochondrion) [Diorhabda carinulata]|uniref:NADH-ubiquinone oxidoreductase chain 5 n=1 Tax=Diorhabda carinulata TaxID=1163345 RepID=A0A4Y5MWK9_9CUCU|nr:NADH dehydrogenase subunit 5 [Diorhabda carinulata]QCW06701.1 NADH dehydrogenase subunit 5 [Diorhabda carinulata]
MYFMVFLYLSLMLLGASLYLLIMNLTYILEFNFMMLNSTNIYFVVLLDWMSLLFMSFVLFISSMVIFYSEEYMAGDIYKNRFILLVVMFVLSMMLLIISPNLISILLGWDGLGLISYCLVIYYQNLKSFSAGMLTALSNRIGDVALLMSIAWMLNFGSWNFIFYLEIMKGDYIMQLISYLVVLAAMTKSAQIPFSSWLPAAMAAPTPVSSLVHSSTLVTAGVYLLIRFNFSFSSNLMMILLFISSMTMFMSGLGANFEFDLKKIIALSTLSQLGLMMSILALGEYKLAFFHLLIHALFKALLFMCAGNIIHNLFNCQDIRYMGGLVKHLPLTCTYLNICNLSLCGLPFMSGFYSKDLVVEFMSMNYLNIYIYLIFYISIGLTVSYSFRLTYYSMIGNFNFMSLHIIQESSMIMLKGMSGLILFVVFSGSMFSWMLFSTPYFICMTFFMKMLTLFVILIGGWLGYELAKFKLSYQLLTLKFLSSSLFMSMMWNMPYLSTLGVNYLPLYMGKLYLKIFDQGWLEYYGGQQMSKNLKMLTLMQLFSINHLKIYLLLLIFWLMFLLLNI